MPLLYIEEPRETHHFQAIVLILCHLLWDKSLNRVTFFLGNDAEQMCRTVTPLRLPRRGGSVCDGGIDVRLSFADRQRWKDGSTSPRSAECRGVRSSRS